LNEIFGILLRTGESVCNPIQHVVMRPDQTLETLRVLGSALHYQQFRHPRIFAHQALNTNGTSFGSKNNL
jgi:hypothetical protein